MNGGSGIVVGLILALMIGFFCAANELLTGDSGEPTSHNADLAFYVDLANGK